MLVSGVYISVRMHASDCQTIASVLLVKVFVCPVSCEMICYGWACPFRVGTGMHALHVFLGGRLLGGRMKSWIFHDGNL